MMRSDLHLISFKTLFQASLRVRSTNPINEVERSKKEKKKNPTLQVT
jgi:hypothetical protein